MSKPIFQNWFAASGRRNRKSFIWAHVVNYIAVWALFILGTISVVSTGSFGIVIFLILIGIPVVVADIFISAQRFRDMSYTGWLALLWIPLMFIDSSVGFALSLAFSIFLCVMPGKVGKNEYGPDPLTETPIYNPPGS